MTQATLIVRLQVSELELRTSDEHCRNSENAAKRPETRSQRIGDVMGRGGLVLNASQFLV